MLKSVDKVLNPTIFKILILITTLVMQVPFIHSAFGGYVKYVLAFGILVACYEFVTGKFKGAIKDKVNLFLILFVVLYAVTIVLNRSDNFAENIKQLIYMVVFFALLFCVNKVDIKVISVVIVIFTFVVSLICLITYCLRIYEWYTLDSYYYVGKVSLVLWGLYNPNTCGAIAVVSIITSLYLIFSISIKKLWLKVLAIVSLITNIVLQYVVLLLSSSRGAFYGLLATLLILSFLAILKNFKRDKFSVIVRVLFASAFCLLLVFSFTKLSTFIQTNKDSICVVSEEDANNTEMDTTFENSLEELLKKYTSSSSALDGLFRFNTLSLTGTLGDATGRYGDLKNTAGRDVIWKAGFKTFLEKPIFGWTREGLVEPTVDKIVNTIGQDSGAVAGGGLHNLYLTVLCSSGIVGFICLATVIVIVLVRLLKVLIKKKPIGVELLFSFVTCMYFFVSELVENRILYQVTFFNVVFWIYFGYLYFFTKSELKEESNEFSLNKTE